MAEVFQTVVIDFSLPEDSYDISITEANAEDQEHDSPYAPGDPVFVDVELTDWDQNYSVTSSTGKTAIHQKNILVDASGSKDVLPGETSITLESFPVKELQVSWIGTPKNVNFSFSDMNINFPENSFGIISYNYKKRVDRWMLYEAFVDTVVMAVLDDYPTKNDSCRITFESEEDEKTDDELYPCNLCEALIVESESSTQVALGSRFYFSVKGAEIAFGGIVGYDGVNPDIRHETIGWKEVIETEETLECQNGVITLSCPIYDYHVLSVDFPNYLEPENPGLVVKNNCNKIYVPDFFDIPKYKTMTCVVKYKTIKRRYYIDIPSSWDGNSMELEMVFAGLHHECPRETIELTVADHIGDITGRNITIYGHDFMNADTPVIGMQVYIGFFGGEYAYQGILDSLGKISIADVPLGTHRIKITSHPIGLYQDTDTDDIENDWIEVT